MKVLITGGAGFLGLRLAKRLLELGELTGPGGGRESIDELVLFDLREPAEVPVSANIRIKMVCGQIADARVVHSLIDQDAISVFHLASVVSGEAEQDFDLGMRVNLDGGRYLLEALRTRGGCPKLVFASSIAVYGGAALSAAVGDNTKQTPQTTYGVTKAVCELLINDYTRKGYLDGRSARLPTVIIRPGKPNAAASSFASGVFREPLKGIDFVLPVPGGTSMVVLGYRAIVEGLIHLHELDARRLGSDRAISLPSLTVTAGEMIEALKRVAGARTLGAISERPDPFITAICQSWPQASDCERAQALKFPRERSVDEIIRYYIEDYLT